MAPPAQLCDGRLEADVNGREGSPGVGRVEMGRQEKLAKRRVALHEAAGEVTGLMHNGN